MEDPQIDVDLIDEAVLALMYLTLHADGPAHKNWQVWRAWKSFDWAAMDRLHDKDLISEPVGKAKSVVLTEEGRRRSEASFYRLFTRRDGHQAPPQS
nr:DUF6429 family protein [Sphingomonas sp. CDS-1]